MNDNVFEKPKVQKRRHQGCSTFVCAVFLGIVFFCLATNTSFQELTDRWIDWGQEKTDSSLKLWIFVTDQSYTAVIDGGNFCGLVNAAENFNQNSVQQVIQRHEKVDVAFLMTDAKGWGGTSLEPERVYATSKFASDYFCQGEYSEDSRSTGSGSLQWRLESDILELHYEESGKVVGSVAFVDGTTSTDPEKGIASLVVGQGAVGKPLAQNNYLNIGSAERGIYVYDFQRDSFNKL